LLERNPDYGKTIAEMLKNQPDVQRIHYAFVLRNMRSSWTVRQRLEYFAFLRQARGWSGGASYAGFIDNIGNEAFENATDIERLALEASGARKPYKIPELPKATGPGQEWNMDKLLALQESGRSGRDFENGKKMFAAARCVVCHRFGGEGGATGPDLTQAAGRFSYKDLCEAIVEPSKVISDQYLASVVETDDGQTFTGRIVSEDEESITVLLDPEDASKVKKIANSGIDATSPSKISVMPGNLLAPLNQSEVLDMLAYLLSRGNSKDPMFAK
ncbi:MAG: c-type cytochrome, partial [Aeoliella sp.]